MNCAGYAEWIARNLEGALPEQDERELAAHLSGCPRCRAEVALQSKIRRALAADLPPALSPGFTETVSRRALARARAERRARWFGKLAPAFALAAGFVLLYLLRMDLVRVLPPVMDVLADAIASPVSWLGDMILGLVARFSSLSGEHIPILEQVSGPLMTTLTVSIFGSIPAFWAFYRIFAFLKD